VTYDFRGRLKAKAYSWVAALHVNDGYDTDSFLAFDARSRVCSKIV
jgi:hypothetical protein